MTQPAPLKTNDILPGVRYEIRGELAHRAQEMERMGYEIVSLNIGKPGLFGYRTPEIMRLAMIENLGASEASARSRFLELQAPAGAMYAFTRVRSERLADFDDRRFALDLLQKKHVLIAPGSSFNVPYRDHFRITTLPLPDVIRDVFGRMEDPLESLAA